jgi:uracil-DNA glycosylase
MDDLLAAAPLSREERIAALAAMDANEVTGCTRCALCRTRTRTVFGEGDPEARIMFIGEGPGDTEDRTGRPFVGRAGQLLDRMIGGMGLKRQQVYIANLVKCRAYIVGPPPKDRAPTPEEAGACAPYLLRQLAIVRPEVIVTLGLPAAKYMLDDPRIIMGRIRGQWRAWRGIRLMPTYHPSYILRQYTDQVRAAVWEDLKQVLMALDLPVPQSKRAQD